MSDQPNARTVAALESVIKQMQYLVEHPRMQQRNWVASGREWLPVLHNAVEDLQRDVKQQDFVVESYQSLLAALGHVGLQVEKRDAASWGYRWQGEALKGTFRTRAEAVEAALREKLK